MLLGIRLKAQSKEREILDGLKAKLGARHMKPECPEPIQIRESERVPRA